MKESKGIAWKVTALVFAVLLAAAIAVTAFVTASSRDAKTKSGAEIQRLEAKVAGLENRAASQETESAAPASGTSASSTGGSEGTEPVDEESDEDIVNAMALDIARTSFPGVPWSTGGTRVVGDWARVGVSAPAEYMIQGQILFFHKISGAWTFVTLGTGLTPGDIPGCPAELFDL